jgi:hypothetical protein
MTLNRDHRVGMLYQDVTDFMVRVEMSRAGEIEGVIDLMYEDESTDPEMVDKMYDLMKWLREEYIREGEELNKRWNEEGEELNKKWNEIVARLEGGG